MRRDTLSAIQVAQAALLEAGQPELARYVRASPNQNASGDEIPMFPFLMLHSLAAATHETVVRALLLAHLALGHQARLTVHHLDLVLRCETCWPGRGSA